MNSNQNNVHPKENIPSENHTKVGIVKEKSKEQDDQCASTCSCEEESITGMEQGVTDTVWKAGCYKINPTTQSGQKCFFLHMMVLPLIPITALVIQNSVTMNTILTYQGRIATIRTQVRGAMEIAVFIQNIQEERAEVALHIFSNQSRALTERFQMTDRALEEVPTWPNFNNRGINKEFMGKAMEETVAGTTAFKSKLTFQIQHEVFRVKVREGSFNEITSILGWYEFINDIILDHLDDEIKSTNKSGVWRYLIAFKNLLRAIENIGIVSVYGIKYLTTGKVTQENFIKYVEHDTLIWEYLNSSIHLAPYLNEKLQNIYSSKAYKFYRESDKMILKTALDAEEGSSNITRTMKYFHSISEYMLELRHLLEELRDDIEGVAQDELNAADEKKIIGIALLTIISIITVLFYFFVRNALSVIKIFARLLTEKMREVNLEKTKTRRAMQDFFPKTITCAIRRKKLTAEEFESTTVFYGEYLGFEDAAKNLTASEFVDISNQICANLDQKIQKFNVHKINHLGGATNELLIISGIPNKMGNKHVMEIASMALDLSAASGIFRIPRCPNFRLQLRMGIHSGPAIGIVTGPKIPRYLVVGLTPDIARVVGRMSEGDRIHISDTTKHLLDKLGGFRCEYRGVLDLGARQCQLETFWLLGWEEDVDDVSPGHRSSTTDINNKSSHY